MTTLAGNANVSGIGLSRDDAGSFYVSVSLISAQPDDELLHEYDGVPIHYQVTGAISAQEAGPAVSGNPDAALYQAWSGLRDQLCADRRVAGIKRSGPGRPPRLTVYLKKDDTDGIPESFGDYRVDIVTPVTARAGSSAN
jgi:hypothetical protein